MWAGSRGVRVEAVGPAAGAVEDKAALQQAREAATAYNSAVPRAGYRKYLQMVLDEEEGTGGEVVGVSDRQLNQQLIAENIASLTDPTTTAEPPLVLAVVDLQDVAYGYGVQGRLEHRLGLLHPTISGDDPQRPPASQNRVVSVLLNPSAADSLAPAVQLRLALAYGDELPEQRPLGDYLWYPTSPPVRLLTHMKNAISREGSKPAEETSILGAF